MNSNAFSCCRQLPIRHRAHGGPELVHFLERPSMPATDTPENAGWFIQTANYRNWCAKPSLPTADVKFALLPQADVNGELRNQTLERLTAPCASGDF
jgi:hypothetical protein